MIKNLKKTEIFQNLIFFSKYKDEAIFFFQTKFGLNLNRNFGEFLNKMSI
jgi:hypothetical protein